MNANLVAATIETTNSAFNQAYAFQNSQRSIENIDATLIENAQPPTVARRFRRLITSLLTLLQPMLFGFVVLVPTNTPMINVCPQFGVPVSGTGYDTTNWTDYNLDAQAIQAVLNINSDHSFWVGYENGGFAWTSDVMPELTLTFTMADGSERWFDVFWSEQTPDAYYALPFANPTPYADANGEHYGTHPCAAILMTGVEYQTLISALNA